MSWDVVILAEAPPEKAGGGELDPLGTADEVRQRVSAALPEVDWSDPEWGLLRGDGGTIEFGVNDTGQDDLMMLEVRGGGDPVAAIANLCNANDWVALDTSTDELIDLENPSGDSWREFQAFRDMALESTEPPPRSFGSAIVPVLAFSACGTMLITGALIGVFLYLKFSRPSGR